MQNISPTENSAKNDFANEYGKATSKSNVECQLCSQDVASIPNDYLMELVNIVYRRTNLDVTKVEEIIRMTLNHMQNTIPSLSGTLQVILNSSSYANTKTGSSKAYDSALSGTLTKLKFHLSHQAKNDMKKEDNDVIHDLLEELLDSLNVEDPDGYHHLIQQDDYHIIQILVSCFQLNYAPSLKLLLAQIFGVICYTMRDSTTILLHSVLPTELDEWNAELIEILLEKIERPPTNDDSVQLPPLFLKTILSFNLHMKDSIRNPVITALQNGITQEFCSSLILLFNRNVDPVGVTVSNQNPSAVIKMMLDMFSSEAVASVFYTNDVKVILDIILRNLTDLPSGDSGRSWNLTLLNRVAAINITSNFYRSEEFIPILSDLYKEEPCFDREHIEKLWL
ncbi:expressed hypothetical protein, partial [Trichoplax adhaerens]